MTVPSGDTVPCAGPMGFYDIIRKIDRAYQSVRGNRSREAARSSRECSYSCPRPSWNGVCSRAIEPTRGAPCHRSSLPRQDPRINLLLIFLFDKTIDRRAQRMLLRKLPV